MSIITSVRFHAYGSLVCESRRGLVFNQPYHPKFAESYVGVLYDELASYDHPPVVAVEFGAALPNCLHQIRFVYHDGSASEYMKCTAAVRRFFTIDLDSTPAPLVVIEDDEPAVPPPAPKRPLPEPAALERSPEAATEVDYFEQESKHREDKKQKSEPKKTGGSQFVDAVPNDDVPCCVCGCLPADEFQFMKINGKYYCDGVCYESSDDHLVCFHCKNSVNTKTCYISKSNYCYCNRQCWAAEHPSSAASQKDL